MDEHDVEDRLHALGQRWRTSMDTNERVSNAGSTNPVRKPRRRRPAQGKVVMLAAAMVAVLAGGVAAVGLLIGGERSSGSSSSLSGKLTASSNANTAPTSYPHSGQRWFLYQCGERIAVTESGIVDQGVQVDMRREGNNYAVSVRVTEPELAKPMQVFTSLVITDSEGVVVGMPSNETMSLKPPTDFSMTRATSLGVISIPHKLTANQSLFSSCTGDSRTPVPADTYTVSAMVRLDADIFGSSAPQRFVYPEQ